MRANGKKNGKKKKIKSRQIIITTCIIHRSKFLEKKVMIWQDLIKSWKEIVTHRNWQTEESHLFTVSWHEPTDKMMIGEKTR